MKKNIWFTCLPMLFAFSLAHADTIWVKDEINVDDIYAIQYKNDTLIVTDLSSKNETYIASDGVKNASGNWASGSPVAVTIEKGGMFSKGGIQFYTELK